MRYSIASSKKLCLYLASTQQPSGEQKFPTCFLRRRLYGHGDDGECPCFRFAVKLQFKSGRPPGPKLPTKDMPRSELHRGATRVQAHADSRATHYVWTEAGSELAAASGNLCARCRHLPTRRPLCTPDLRLPERYGGAVRIVLLSR
jgi:hypothetical protein